jgi:hypothetical protein
LDEEAILKSLAKQNVLSLLKSTYWRSWRVFQELALNNPAPQEFVVNDSFGESGTPAQLMENTN